MIATSTRQAVLLLAEASSPNGDGFDAAVGHRLESVLGFEVINAKSCPDHISLSSGSVVSLVVVCCSAPPPRLRHAPIPVIVCNPAALPVLGMTGPREHVDFGTEHPAQELQVVERHHVLTAALQGLPTVLGPNGTVGWGRPFPAALRIAVPLDCGPGGHVSVFAYAGGQPIQGMSAPAARSAVLLQSPDNTITADGWALFDAAVRWSCHQGAFAHPSGTTGTNADPTHTLSRDDYRDWVQEHVAKKVWRRMLFWGAGGVFAIISFMMYWTHLHFDNEKHGMVNAVTADVRDDLGRSVVKTMIEYTELANATRKQLKQDLTAYFMEQSTVAEMAPRVISALLEEPHNSTFIEGIKVGLSKEGAIRDIILEALVNTYANASSDADRLETLQLASVFNPVDSRLQELRMTVLKDATSSEPLWSFAMRSCRPSTDEETGSAMELVLGRLSMLRAFGAETRANTAEFVGRLPDRNCERLLIWIRNPANEIARSAVLEGISRMDGIAPLTHLADIAVQRESTDEVKLGCEGLISLKAQSGSPNWMAARQKAIRQLWDAIRTDAALKQLTSSGSALRFRSLRDAERLMDVLKTGDPKRLGELRRESLDLPTEKLEQIYKYAEDGGAAMTRLLEFFPTTQEMLRFLVGQAVEIPQNLMWRTQAMSTLLRPGDWDSLDLPEPPTATPFDGGEADSLHAEALCFVWAQFLQGMKGRDDADQEAESVLRWLLARPDWVTRAGFAGNLDVYLSRVSGGVLGEVFAKLAREVSSPKASPGAYFYQALAAALRSDQNEDRNNAYHFSANFMERIHGLAPEQKIVVKEHIYQALVQSVNLPNDSTDRPSEVVRQFLALLDRDDNNGSKYALAALRFLTEHGGDSIVWALESSNAYHQIHQYAQKSDLPGAAGVAALVKAKLGWIHNIDNPRDIDVDNQYGEVHDATKYSWFRFEASIDQTYYVTLNGTNARCLLVSGDQDEVLFVSELRDDDLLQLPRGLHGARYVGLQCQVGVAPAWFAIHEAAVLSPSGDRADAPRLDAGQIYTCQLGANQSGWARLQLPTFGRTADTYALTEGVDTVLAIYCGGATDPMVENDDAENEWSLRSSLQWHGRDHIEDDCLIQIKNIGSRDGSFALKLSRLPSDAIRRAISLAAQTNLPP